MNKWDAIARLVALHGEACAALALLRCGVGGWGAGWLDEVAARQRDLAAMLLELARVRGAPRSLRTAARRHVEAVGQMLA